jgi:hypothetical protein
MVALPGLLRRTQGRILRRSSAHHIDARVDGLERGASIHEAIFLKAKKARKATEGTEPYHAKTLPLSP